MTSGQALRFIKGSGGPGIELHSCDEAGPFGCGLHSTPEGMGIKTSSGSTGNASNAGNFPKN